ncbi:hypothetical protein [Xenorhabdus sp. KK7.4]|uniref:hypothetical protein n=1 Tax=Xenorhabdus sp. KK7.4 TaxID=1851572 RepID=UPI000C0487B7|nr:hypothetical protein [Xenorhabdus sp. KK7.4]PHM55831.1 outer membrane protein NilC [Xenorhabdus sp. KK7.4]
MNAKSKIFLALALVLSVTACSKGGGSHHSISDPKTKTPEPIINLLPKATPDNTYIAYKPDPPDSQYTMLHLSLGKNVWFAASGDYSVKLGGGTPESEAQDKIDFGQNQQDPGKYDYIQFGLTGDTFYIGKDLGDPNYKLFKNRANNATLGRTDKDIYLASPWMVADTRNDGTHTYSGNVIFQEDTNKIRHDLTMTLNTNKVPNSSVLTAGASIYFGGQEVANVKPYAFQDQSQYMFQGITPFESERAEFSFLKGQTMSWGYTDKDATGISGILGDVNNKNQFGAFLLNKD